jgi:GTPase SAR1 family protein
MPSSSLTILFLGATGTGKSSLIKRMAAKPFSEGYIPTIGYSIEKTSIIK